MKVNTAKQKMLAGQPAFGYSVGLGSPTWPRCWRTPASTSSCSTASTARSARRRDDRTASDGDAPAARRSRWRASPATTTRLIGRLLDEGALGIVVPMVHTPRRPRPPPTPAASRRSGRARGAGAAPRTTATTTRLDQRAGLRRRPDREHPGSRERRGDHGHARRRRLLARPIRPGAVDGHPPARHGERRPARQARRAGAPGLPQHRQDPRLRRRQPGAGAGAGGAAASGS